MSWLSDGWPEEETFSYASEGYEGPSAIVFQSAGAGWLVDSKFMLPGATAQVVSADDLQRGIERFIDRVRFSCRELGVDFDGMVERMRRYELEYEATIEHARKLSREDRRRHGLGLGPDILGN